MSMTTETDLVVADSSGVDVKNIPIQELIESSE